MGIYTRVNIHALAVRKNILRVHKGYETGCENFMYAYADYIEYQSRSRRVIYHRSFLIHFSEARTSPIKVLMLRYRVIAIPSNALLQQNFCEKKNLSF